MVQAYNFLASWQLFPEKCTFDYGLAPKSGNFKIESIQNGQGISLINNWVSLDNEAFYSQYEIIPDNTERSFSNTDLADIYIAHIPSSYTLQIDFLKKGVNILKVIHEIMPNGYLKITQEGINNEGNSFRNTEIYHKQLSVLPYSSSVAGVAIRPTKEGLIKHKALSAMEDQTNMQLDQIRQQIELLAKQAQEIRKRKELSMMIYETRLSFKPQIGHIYHLYEKKDGAYMLSLVAPNEWGKSGPFKQFVSSVKLLADHTWVEISA
jgi:predicted transcriptional regulator